VASDTALFVLGQLLQHGRVRRASLGVAGQTAALPRRLARAAGIAAGSGVRVSELLPGGPAERAGVRAGDVLLALDAVPLLGVDDLVRALTEGRIGREATLRLLRGREVRSLAVRPAERRPDG
jgi:S1-C subfamily serine protease